MIRCWATMMHSRHAAATSLPLRKNTHSLLWKRRFQSSEAAANMKKTSDEAEKEISSLAFHLNVGQGRRLKFEFQLGEIVSLLGLIVAVVGVTDWIQQKIEDRKAGENFSKQGLDLALQETNLSLNILEANGTFGMRTLMVVETKDIFPHTAQMKALHLAAHMQKPEREDDDDDDDSMLDKALAWVEETTGLDIDSDGCVGEAVLGENVIEKVRPYLYLDDDEKVERLKRQIKGKISQLGSGSYLAEDMGIPVITATYVWGMTFEYLDKKHHERKLRIFLVHIDLLKKLSKMDANQLPIPKGGSEARRQYYRERVLHLQKLWQLYSTGKKLREARKGLLIGDVEMCMVAGRDVPRSEDPDIHSLRRLRKYPLSKNRRLTIDEIPSE